MNDSIWATVAGVARALGMTAQQSMYDISYMNAIMYSRTIPVYSGKKEENNEPLYDEKLDANDTSKFNDFDDEEIVRV